MTEHYRDAALRMIRAIPKYKELSYLELGCGDGFILEALHRDGARARGTTYRAKDEDYIRTRPYPEHLEVDGGIDLNKPLPYADEMFDVVYSTEVIEHVEGHRNFVTEAARVLKPGGYLVLTTPNVHRILSRFSFALSGMHLSKQEPVPWTYELSRMEEFHHRCVEFPLLHWLLWKSGLRIEEMTTTEVKAASKLALVLKPVLAMMTRRAVMRHVRPEAEDRQAREDLLKWMMSGPLLTSEQMCVRVRKVRPSAQK